MKIVPHPPKKALNKAFLKHRPSRNEIELFKVNLVRLLGKIDEIEREENQKNHVRDFLRDTFYKETNEINTKDSKDLVIHLGESNKDKVGVIIEAKRPSNKIEMLTVAKPNSKAFQELVLYYLRERIEENNIDIKYCIVTNIYEWYIFDASYFEKLFFKNKAFVKEYEQWRDGKKVTKDTSLFYNEIAKPFIDKLTDEISCSYFDIRTYEKILFNNDLADDKNLIALYKILSPYHLLKIPFADDSNKLDDKFYQELLHLIGLGEVKEGGKWFIRRKDENRDEGSLLESVITILETENINRVTDLSNYGDTKQERLFSIGLELCITWINRILFLKLLEGQLVNYHKGDRRFRFLNTETIHDYDELYKLFHQVLAKPNGERLELIKKKYSRVPYLNSSLFEISDLENQTIKISALDNTSKLELINITILKEEKKLHNTLPTLDYLFKFLDAYDFASDGSEDIQDDNKTLINASVLGKVFEKINGYKDGSVYTPGLITMFMCKQAIRLSIMEKFKSQFGWNLNQFEDLKNYTADRRSSKEVLELNEVINSLRLCDPAVGSGHFLVSSLNEIIAVKSELGILADEKGIRLSNYEIIIENDELIVTDQNGDFFEYHLLNGKPENKEAQRLQKALFHEKESIIENCLFGVDINSNSVKICRLRLWIELLKNAYYKEETYTELETLPNIDINIKCGNSLLSRFNLKSDLSQVFKQQKFSYSAYRSAVDKYKRTPTKETKEELQSFLKEITEQFKSVFFSTDPLLGQLSTARGQRILLDNNINLFGEKIKDAEKVAIEKKRLDLRIKHFEEKIFELKNNVVYKHAFEWRFEFPEVLDNNGDFLGFDVIIGNPPYIESRSSAIDEKFKDEVLNNIQKRRPKDADLITRGSDLLIYFFELGLCLLKKQGYFSFITQNSWLDTDYGFKFQKFLKKNTKVIGVFDNDIKYFDESANINTIITLFEGNEGADDNEIGFARLNTGFEKVPFEPKQLFEKEGIGQIVKVKQSDTSLDKIKWGILLNSDSLIIELHKRLFAKSTNIQPYRIGQGLNLTKEYFISVEQAERLKIPSDKLLPFFTNEDGAPFSINETSLFLFDSTELTEKQIERINEAGLKIPEIKKATRHKPTLILPRGVGRYFCARNMIGAYSSSFVEVYLQDKKENENDEKYLWLFLNSSIGWLIREISGRKNLGGGMLKAEAIDLKSYPLLFDFKDELPTINQLFKTLSKREAENCLKELNTQEHIEIDNIVFKKLGFNAAEKKQLVQKLFDMISFRTTKSKTKL